LSLFINQQRPYIIDAGTTARRCVANFIDGGSATLGIWRRLPASILHTGAKPGQKSSPGFTLQLKDRLRRKLLRQGDADLPLSLIIAEIVGGAR
jgi:hypothetical protein